MKNIDTNRLLSVGIALTREKDGDKLLETILTAAMDITCCDAGTLYIVEDDALRFRVMITRSLGVRQGSSLGEITLPPVPLRRPEGTADPDGLFGPDGLNHSNVCAVCALTGRLINIPDVYRSTDFDFSGPRRYDAMTGYRTASMLVVPLESDKGETIGVLQMMNAMDEADQVIPFDPGFEPVIASLGSQAAISLTNMNYAKEVTELLDSFVRVMSTAIDARSPYNANHTRNMVRYGEAFIDWLDAQGSGWRFDAQQRRQFLMSVWLHDVGKLVTPLEIMDKQTRLGDRYETVAHRLDTLALHNRIDGLTGRVPQTECDAMAEAITGARALVDEANTVGFLPDDKLAAVQAVARQAYTAEDGTVTPFLTPDELTALSIRKGTLTAEERAQMEGHVTMTAKMLGEMTFSTGHKLVPQWAAAHHEFINGGGYPQGLTGDQIPREVRLLTILDIFDALTARDRPYKAGMSAERAFEILEFMVRDGQVDGDILALFRASDAWHEDVSHGA